MSPISASLATPPRVYRTVHTRPITESGLELFKVWVEEQRWIEIYACLNAHDKAEKFQKLLIDNFEKCFPIKSLKICDDDQCYIANIRVQNKVWYVACYDDVVLLDKKNNVYSEHLFKK